MVNVLIPCCEVFLIFWNSPALKALCRSVELDKVDGQSPRTIAFGYRVDLTPLIGRGFLDNVEIQQLVDLRADG